MATSSNPVIQKLNLSCSVVAHDVKRVTEWTVSVGHEEVLLSISVRHIRAMLDSTLTMESQVNGARKLCLCSDLSEEAAKSLILAHSLGSFQAE